MDYRGTNTKLNQQFKVYPPEEIISCYSNMRESIGDNKLALFEGYFTWVTDVCPKVFLVGNWY